MHVCTVCTICCMTGMYRHVWYIYTHDYYVCQDTMKILTIRQLLSFHTTEQVACILATGV